MKTAPSPSNISELLAMLDAEEEQRGQIESDEREAHTWLTLGNVLRAALACVLYVAWINGLHV